MDINQRLILVQSWWLASELVRRHPVLTIHESHPGGGLYDCLTLAGRERWSATHIDFNRAGRIHIHPDQVGFMTWEKERDYGDRHGALKRIEAAAGLQPPKKTPPSGPKVLTYRVVSRLLAATLNEREAWDARAGDARPVLNEFPAAEAAAPVAHRGDSGFDSLARFWVISAGARHVAALDTDGRVYLPDGSVRRLDVEYLANDRSILRAMAATLGPILP